MGRRVRLPTPDSQLSTHGKTLKLLYLANNRIPSEKANSLQIMQSCAAFARQGAEVSLVVPHRLQPKAMRGVGRVDLADRSLLKKIAEDYNRGAEEHGIWGTPTLVLEGGQAAYVKMRPAPPDEDSLSTFETLLDIIRNRPYLLEIKRPR